MWALHVVECTSPSSSTVLFWGWRVALNEAHSYLCWWRWSDGNSKSLHCKCARYGNPCRTAQNWGLIQHVRLEYEAITCPRELMVLSPDLLPAVAHCYTLVPSMLLWAASSPSRRCQHGDCGYPTEMMRLLNDLGQCTSRVSYCHEMEIFWIHSYMNHNNCIHTKRCAYSSCAGLRHFGTLKNLIYFKSDWIFVKMVISSLSSISETANERQ